VVSLEDLRTEIARFAAERNWDQFHSIRNLVLAMVGEVGEVAEILQWTEDDKIGELLASGGRERLAEELADVLIYLIQIAKGSGVDLESAVRAKLAANALKYPVECARGSARKYDALGD
jgi:dCTP diphosphatase